MDNIATALLILLGTAVLMFGLITYDCYKSNCAYNNGYSDGFSEHNNTTYHYAMNYVKVHEDRYIVNGTYYIGYCDGYIDRETNHTSN